MRLTKRKQVMIACIAEDAFRNKGMTEQEALQYAISPNVNICFIVFDFSTQGRTRTGYRSGRIRQPLRAWVPSRITPT